MKNKKSNRKKIFFAAWISCGEEAVCEILAKAGFQQIVIDLEHSCISISQAEKLIRVIELAGASPFVRVGSINNVLIKRVLDAGAHGIIVPNVVSVSEARQAVNATKYPPYGTRGVGLGRAQGYGTKFLEYFRWQKKNIKTIVQIESIKALNDLDKILREPGISGFLIGPYDLSCSLGIPGRLKRPKYRAIEQKILAAGRIAKCPAGIHIVEPDVAEVRRVLKMGYRIVIYSVDFRMLDVSARNGIAAAKSWHKK